MALCRTAELASRAKTIPVRPCSWLVGFLCLLVPFRGERFRGWSAEGPVGDVALFFGARPKYRIRTSNFPGGAASVSDDPTLRLNRARSPRSSPG